MIRPYALFLVLAGLLLCGCTAQKSEELSSSDQNMKMARVIDRVEQLEQSMKAMQDKGEKSLVTVQSDLAAVRTQLETLTELLKEKGLAGTESSKQGFDESARSFARESLRRMLDLSKDVMKNLEKELDKTLKDPQKKSSGSAPQGESSI